MSQAEREYIKSIDEKILSATGKELKELQELDLKCQESGLTIYDILSSKRAKSQEKSISSSVSSSRKQKDSRF